MNNYRTGEVGSPIDQNAMLNITNQLRKQCFIPKTDMGDVIYEWMDNHIENFSSVRLAEIIFWADQNVFVDSCFIQAAKRELIKRGHHEQSLGWKFIG